MIKLPNNQKLEREVNIYASLYTKFIGNEAECLNALHELNLVRGTADMSWHICKLLKEILSKTNLLNIYENVPESAIYLDMVCNTSIIEHSIKNWSTPFMDSWEQAEEWGEELLQMAEYEAGQVIKVVDEAMYKHDIDVLSVDYNEETGMIDINECHHAWSAPVVMGITYAKTTDLNYLVHMLDIRGIGHCGL